MLNKESIKITLDKYNADIKGMESFVNSINSILWQDNECVRIEKRDDRFILVPHYPEEMSYILDGRIHHDDC